MSRMPFTIIDQQQAHEIGAEVSGSEVRISAAAVHEALGWKVERRGLCRGQTCIATAGVAGLINDAGIELQKLAELLDRPLAVDLEHRVAALAAPSGDRARALASLEAPDFTLPDLEGRLHSLSDYRGSKVLLLAHASW